MIIPDAVWRIDLGHGDRSGETGQEAEAVGQVDPRDDSEEVGTLEVVKPEELPPWVCWVVALATVVSAHTAQGYVGARGSLLSLRLSFLPLQEPCTME